MPTEPAAKAKPPRLKAVRSLARASVDRIWILASAARRTFRRSLQVRMVTYTLIASSLLVTVFGVVVASRIQNGLVDTRVKSAQEQLASGRQYAEDQLGAYSRPDDSDLSRSVQGVLDNLTKQSPGFEGDASAVIVPASPSIPFPPMASGPNKDIGQAITPQLQVVVAGGHVAHQFVTAELQPGRPQPALVVGAPVDVTAGTFALYYVLPMDSEVASANMIGRNVIITGVALVLLLAVMAALVTRLVVNPVRAAARTAQRLSAGLLDQRMEVRGEDDLARLAASFNQMAANLQRQIVRLEEMSRLQRRFTSDVSHELRTPLTTVRMAADLLYSSRDELDPLMARSAELLNAELDRFEELLTDLLEISRFDAGFAVLDAEPTDLVVVVDRVVDRLAPLARHAGVSVAVKAPGTAAIAEVDPRRVERIVRNLIGNAIEHSEGRPVVVTLGVDESAVAVTVRDFGIGLKPGEEKLVFNRFWRADPSRARQTGGTGLGLSISLEDARLHGGWLEAWGVPGKGAQFRLVVPLRAGGRLQSSPLPLVPIDESAARPGVTTTEAAHA
jgi:two-component system, OmpR family, sensor histidine kinase MtrB